MANKCTNFLFESDGYCTRCGKYHYQKQTTKKKIKVVAVYAGDKK